MTQNAANEKTWTVLSVKAPWSHLICRGFKDVENRSWATPYRGRLYIHSSGKPLGPDEAKAELHPSLLRAYPEAAAWITEAAARGEGRGWLETGAILGYVDLADCVEDAPSPWAQAGNYHWKLSGAVLFDEPVRNVPGRLRLWEFDPERGRTALSADGGTGADPDAAAAAEEKSARAAEAAKAANAGLEFTTVDAQASFYAWDLSRRSSEDGYARIAGSLMGAQVDLNPHQVDAALFALKSPLSKGAILADEVGLGKTIEAGIVLAQKWAERRRKLLLVLPATLRKQWSTELAEKFYLPSVILENKSFKEARARGEKNPFDRDDAIVLTSYQFAAKNADYVRSVGWNLVVVDEAHRVRNSWQKGNKMGRALRDATAGSRKLLLTATPLQNSAMELFGLLGFIDSHAFGSEDSFRAQYVRLADDGKFRELRERIAPFFYRTLRRHVLEYVKYTKRIALTETFAPAAEEKSFYDDFTAWLRTPVLLSLPSGQRSLMTLVLHKLLASSTFALESALGRMVGRLQDKEALLDEGLLEDLDGQDAEAEDWEEESGEEAPAEAGPEALRAELGTLVAFRYRLRSISANAKGDKLLTALDAGFRKMRELGAADKAVIFTESRRTQKYLLEVLSDSPYAGSVVLFNGENSDPRSKEIYRAWLAANAGSDRITGSPTADMRAALVDEFRSSARVMIATEAAAEGVNLQFCSLVVNYDLPWNPQRIEQRIGRCHRYGQKHDVVVVNFLNAQNRADERVYELLNEKLKLFEGVFGASDEVLGALGSGVDFEKRILETYRTCRTKDEIDAAFDALQLELDASIGKRMAATKEKVLDNLDEEVHERLKFREDEARAVRGVQERSLYYLAKHLLAGKAEFDDAAFRFRRGGEAYEFAPAPGSAARAFRLQHPLAQGLAEEGRALRPRPASVRFFYTGKPVMGALEDYVGRSGWMAAAVVLRENGLETEELLATAALTDEGDVLHPDAAAKLFRLPARELGPAPEADERLEGVLELQLKTERDRADARNRAFFSQEIDKMELWAEDLKDGLELRIKELEGLIKENKRASALAATLPEKLEFQKKAKDLESERNAQRRRLFDAQDEIDARRDQVIAEIEGQLKAREEVRRLFVLRWELR